MYITDHEPHINSRSPPYSPTTVASDKKSSAHERWPFRNTVDSYPNKVAMPWVFIFFCCHICAGTETYFLKGKTNFRQLLPIFFFPTQSEIASVKNKTGRLFQVAIHSHPRYPWP